MLHVTESAKGLQFSVDISNPTQINILESLLESAGVMFVKTQQDAWYIHFKVDAADAGKIKSLVAGWSTAMSDIQYGLDVRRKS
jgi:hypothetical protein